MLQFNELATETSLNLHKFWKKPSTNKNLLLNKVLKVKEKYNKSVLKIFYYDINHCHGEVSK